MFATRRSEDHVSARHRCAASVVSDAETRYPWSIRMHVIEEIFEGGADLDGSYAVS